MKKSFFLAFVLCACFSLNISAQASADTNSAASKPSQEEIKNFILVRYQFRDFFLKLDTRSGVMTFISYDKSSKKLEELPFYPLPIVPEEEQVPGRFNLYILSDGEYYGSDYILLDQISGKNWLVSELHKRVAN